MIGVPEVWLRGPVDGVAEELQPVAHALLQAEEDLRELLDGVPAERLWARPGSAASAAYHVLHMAGSLDRLLTYARGERLGDAQLRALREEGNDRPELGSAELVEVASTAIAAALEQVRNTPAAALGASREVGRARLPSTVRGLLFHAAEHTTRHAGQVSTTLRALGVMS